MGRRFTQVTNIVSDSTIWRDRFNGLSQGNKVSLLSFVPPCVREFGYGLPRVDASTCNIAHLVEDQLIAKVHLPLLDYFENESHVADHFTYSKFCLSNCH